MDVSAVVIGAGVSGLSCALALSGAGVSVRVLTREPSMETTSTVAAAVWHPSAEEPADRVRAWERTTRERFSTLARTAPGAAIRPLRITEVFRDGPPTPSWAAGARWFTRLDGDEAPDGYAAAFVVDSFAVDPPAYLTWMLRRIDGLGVPVTVDPAGVRSVTEAARPGEIVVDCSGLGAREVCGDTSLFPVRGQVVHVEAPCETPGWIDESDPDRIAYVFPRPGVWVLGGTRVMGSDSTVPDPAETARIVEDCSRLVPEVAGARILDVQVGLRPGRPTVRLEREEIDGVTVVHDYGHGGSGFTLSWGCALEVVDLVLAAGR